MEERMNAVAEIEAAIKMLTNLRASGTPFGWHVATLPGAATGAWRVLPDGYESFDSGDYGDVAKCTLPGDAELIATLHRTVDAQIGILRAGVGGASDLDNGATPDEPHLTGYAIALARAVNGGAS
jgi:hypothetical protein